MQVGIFKGNVLLLLLVLPSLATAQTVADCFEEGFNSGVEALLLAEGASTEEKKPPKTYGECTQLCQDAANRCQKDVNRAREESQETKNRCDSENRRMNREARAGCDRLPTQGQKDRCHADETRRFDETSAECRTEKLARDLRIDQQENQCGKDHDNCVGGITYSQTGGAPLCTGCKLLLPECRGAGSGQN